MEKWLEVDLGKLENNIKVLRQHIKVPIMAVLKHNAYGLGAVTVGKFLEKNGIRFFAVGTLKEGVELRKGGVFSPILVFAPCFDSHEDLNSLWQYNLIPAVYSLEMAETINAYAVKAGRTIDVHVKIDTGMGRMGWTPAEMLRDAKKIKQMAALNFTGIFTHYSNAFEGTMQYTAKQRSRFLSLVRQLEKSGLYFPLKYSANSTAALKFPSTHMDMVTIGSALLGSKPADCRLALKRVCRGRVRVLQVKRLKQGSFIGYSNTCRLKKDTTIAVLAIGYANGFEVQKRIDTFRLVDFLREQINLVRSYLSPRKVVFFKGRPMKILGKTSMQLTVIDAGSLPLKAGDVVDIDINPILADGLMERVYVVQTSAADIKAVSRAENGLVG